MTNEVRATSYGHGWRARSTRDHNSPGSNWTWLVYALIAIFVIVTIASLGQCSRTTHSVAKAPAQVQMDHSFYISPPVPRQVRVRMHGRVVQQLRWDHDSVYNHLGFVPDITERVKLAIRLGQHNGDRVWLSLDGRRHALSYAQAMEMANGKNKLLIMVGSHAGEHYDPARLH